MTVKIDEMSKNQHVVDDFSYWAIVDVKQLVTAINNMFNFWTFRRISL